jgi:hypothetical protein
MNSTYQWTKVVVDTARLLIQYRCLDSESIVEHVAGVEDYQLALATFRAACQRWPGIPITLRQGARLSRTVGVCAPRRGRWLSQSLEPTRGNTREEANGR